MICKEQTFAEHQTTVYSLFHKTSKKGNIPLLLPNLTINNHR